LSLLPVLRTARLLLRPFELSDALEVRRLAGDQAVALTTLHIPHPYPEGAAEQWIASHEEKFEKGEMMDLAITLAADQALIGAIGLVLCPSHSRAELGYWIVRPFWGNGFATEAGWAVLKYGFETLRLNRIQASHFVKNPAS
jgi:[ribosomal protein S5]-alanine N-acetyltransferase